MRARWETISVLLASCMEGGYTPFVRVDMKKMQRSRTRKSVSEEMLAEYSFDYQKARPNRFAGRVDKGRVIVILDPDVSEVFPDQQTVNTALRALINAVPRLPSPKTARS